eukprot:1149684-Pelagomonas_calceolata.AAC.1
MDMQFVSKFSRMLVVKALCLHNTRSPIEVDVYNEFLGSMEPFKWMKASHVPFLSSESMPRCLGKKEA